MENIDNSNSEATSTGGIIGKLHSMNYNFFLILTGVQRTGSLRPIILSNITDNIDIEAIDDFVFLSSVPDLSNLDISFRSSVFNDVEENKENTLTETREPANAEPAGSN